MTAVPTPGPSFLSAFPGHRRRSCSRHPTSGAGALAQVPGERQQGQNWTEPSVVLTSWPPRAPLTGCVPSVHPCPRKTVTQGHPHEVFHSEDHCPLMDRYQGPEITRSTGGRQGRQTHLPHMGRATHPPPPCASRQVMARILVFNPKTMETFWLPANLTEQADEVGCAGSRIF